MKLSVFGTGYVGLVTGACFAEMGNSVTCVDIDAEKINSLSRGIIPIYEPGLSELVERNVINGQLKFSLDGEAAVASCDICFIAVGTPMGKDGSADLQYVLAVADTIGRNMTGDTIVVIKSTVPVGTSGKAREVIAQRLAERGESFTFRMVSNPEFLKEGTAVNDCLRPDRVILGVSDEESAEIMSALYAPFMKNSYRAVVMDIPSAEMTKYAANAMLALRISFMNELSSVCEAVGADINNVRIGIGSDGRIGYKFLYAGCGYGGSCFPKDVRALIVTAKENGCTADILEAAESVNERQKLVLVNKIIKKFGEDLSGRKFAVWGIAFKPDTDDTRYAPSLSIISELTKRGAVVTAYDPLVKVLPEKNDAVTVAPDKYKALEGADALILVTEWKAFRSPDFDEIKAKLKTPVIFDGRNQYDAATLRGAGFYYEQIGRQS